MKRSLVAFIAALGISTTAHAADYKIVPEKSSIGFSGVHADQPFKGSFTKWTATIRFDPENLGTSAVDVTIETSSATTGNKMYDGTLPSEDWFNVKQFPTAHFVSNKIGKAADGSYVADGTLTIRDVSKPVQLAFTTNPAGSAAPHMVANATAKLDRLAFHLGEKSDPTADWVKRDIQITIALEADVITP